MSSNSRDLHEPDENLYPIPAKGLLRIGVPHWTAEVHVFDNLFCPVAGVGKIREEPRTADRYVTEVALSPGIYEVEVTLEGKTRSELFSVRPGKTTFVPSDTWKDLKLRSVAPLADTDTGRKAHIVNAERWSREATWKDAPGGKSRLFLFVRTIAPEPHGLFAAGLSLLDADGGPLTDFSHSARTNPRAGWMAFNADLPPGPYILRRGGGGGRVRPQLLYLFAGWGTPAFVAARHRASPRTPSMNMAPRGTGFRSKDEASFAADLILEGLAHGGSGRRTVNSEKMEVLLRDSSKNPWLGILAAYGLQRSLEERAGEEQDVPRGEVADLLADVLAALTVIEDHPDVRALRLANDAVAPFWYPPLLRAGLKRVQRHATRFAETIPLGSLTDCVLDHLLTNSPWTAWRYLDRLPHGPETVSTVKPSKRLVVRAQAEAPPPLFAVAALHSTQPKAP